MTIDKIECDGTEKQVTGCRVYIGDQCNVYEQVVGVRCLRDPQSLCGPGEYSHGDSCYKLISDEASTRERARSLCEDQGGHLVHIHSQVGGSSSFSF